MICSHSAFEHILDILADETPANLTQANHSAKLEDLDLNPLDLKLVKEEIFGKLGINPEGKTLFEIAEELLEKNK